MSRQLKHKPKSKFKGKRKPPQFGEMILTILKDATLTLEEMMEKEPTRKLDEESGRIKVTYDQLPEDVTSIESMLGNWVFKDARLFRHLDLIEKALGEFGDEFYAEEGHSVEGLRFDRKGRTWGDQGTVLGLAYLAIGAGLAEWTTPKSEWKPNTFPNIKFIKQEGENTHGIAKEYTSEASSSAH